MWCLIPKTFPSFPRLEIEADAQSELLWSAGGGTFLLNRFFPAALPIREKTKTTNNEEHKDPSDTIQNQVVDAAGLLNTHLLLGQLAGGCREIEPERYSVVNAL